jgi:TnpA family transposase
MPGTVRDSLYLLDTLLRVDADHRPEVVVTDTAGYSDMIFGLFRLLGYQTPRGPSRPHARVRVTGGKVGVAIRLT